MTGYNVESNPVPSYNLPRFVRFDCQEWGFAVTGESVNAGAADEDPAADRRALGLKLSLARAQGEMVISQAVSCEVHRPGSSPSGQALPCGGPSNRTRILADGGGSTHLVWSQARTPARMDGLHASLGLFGVLI